MGSTTDMDKLFSNILNAQALYPRLFSNREEGEYCTFFYNANNTLSVEANHGVILCPTDYAAAIEECDRYYAHKALPARLYCYLPPEEEAALTAAANALGKRVTPSPLQLLTCRQPKVRSLSSPLTFERLRQWDGDINQNIIGENLHLEGLLRGSMNHESYTLTIGRAMGVPVTMAGLWDDGEVMRISNVMTGESFRGCGFAGALIIHLLSLAGAKEKPAYLFADNPVAIRVYQRDGMQVEDPGFRLFVVE